MSEISSRQHRLAEALENLRTSIIIYLYFSWLLMLILIFYETYVYAIYKFVWNLYIQGVAV